ncbi:hydrogenase expression/formation protein HypE [Desulfurobacterium atlanticum]|uniref:Hydrogenase expression/formation protein HypE n=1 Tax=Desulfurobacterium atlanticum TaxID=240169 RepID=A0A238YCT4_9BACT|nr:hydrogenase expression/formation protein HypE [Desulfurobacterium atlanticum]SNR68423.1 hydrogenase expression/formation protein HypE [Desulfurobacterium atlanticum]
MEKIEIAHGSGGSLTKELIENIFLKYLDFEELKSLQDSAYIRINSSKIAMTTDSYVVKPYKFPGGNTGKLSVCGTVNDLTVSGAVPKFLSLGLIVEEGLPIKELEEIIKTIAETAKSAGVSVVTGDTKVVEQGKCDRIYINTAGIGEIKRTFSSEKVKPGDLIIVTGTVGDHGIAISLAREEFDMEIPVESDCAPLNSLLVPLFDIEGVKWMRDPTRGGVATVAVELSEMADCGITLFEDKIPVKESVNFVCDMLGYDPLYLANEGKALIVVDKKDAEKVLKKLKEHPLGKESAIIGEITDRFKGVRLKTKIGGERILDLLEDDPLPRIC